MFDSLGLKPPTTWDEYAADAATIHAKNPKQSAVFLLLQRYWRVDLVSGGVKA